MSFSLGVIAGYLLGSGHLITGIIIGVIALLAWHEDY